MTEGEHHFHTEESHAGEPVPGWFAEAKLALIKAVGGSREAINTALQDFGETVARSFEKSSIRAMSITSGIRRMLKAPEVTKEEVEDFLQNAEHVLRETAE